MEDGVAYVSSLGTVELHAQDTGSGALLRYYRDSFGMESDASLPRVLRAPVGVFLERCRRFFLNPLP